MNLMHRTGMATALVALMLTGCVTAASDAPSAERAPVAAATAPAASGATLLRSSLLVADADRSIAFYGLLGFRVESDTGRQPRRPEGSPFPLNAASTWYRLVILGSANGAGGRIGLVDFGDPAPAPRRDSARAVGRGDLVFVFDVADADAVHEALRRGGAEIHETPQVYTSARQAPDGRPLRGKVFHAWDPDGNLIELLEPPK
jgi:catechol 2,3-dioxygenase-like lactoylglutathione lyase family enzyme